MGTITITSSGFAALPATTPPQWPANIAYPGAVAPNGTRTFTISDADMQAVIIWFASTGTAGQTPTVSQILVSWLSYVFNTLTARQVQNYFITPPVVPPPPTFT